MFLERPIEALKHVIALGPSVFLPIIMFFGGLLIGMRPLQAFSAALLLGVAFQAVSLVIEFILKTIGPVGRKLVEETGLQLVAFDLGWAPAAAMSWA